MHLAGKMARTASMTTEILDGFDVIRTRDVSDTFKTYSQLTKALIKLFNPLTCPSPAESWDRPLLTFQEFNQMVANMKKLTVQDIWGLMLMRISGQCPCNHPNLGTLIKSAA